MRARVLGAAVALGIVVLGATAVSIALWDPAGERDAAGGPVDGTAATSGGHAGGGAGTDAQGDAGGHAGHGSPGSLGEDIGEPARHIGPQGRVGQFVAKCTYSHSSSDDPIVWYDQPGRSHRHDFYGAVGTDATSSPEDLLAQQTTCDKPADRAAYWQPTLYDHGEVVQPSHVNAYYRAAPGVEPTDVEPYPFGLAMIAGDATATAPQPGEAAGWVCGTQTTLSDDPPECSSGAPLHLVLTFPDCWDGVNTDSEGHKAHVAYSEDGDCPRSHPVHVPQLTMSVKYPIWGPGHALSLASGGVHSAHGDFFNAWDPAGLRREVEGCIHRDVVCDLASNREEEALFQAQ
jgi:hypothetical protein